MLPDRVNVAQGAGEFCRIGRGLFFIGSEIRFGQHFVCAQGFTQLIDDRSLDLSGWNGFYRAGVVTALAGGQALVITVNAPFLFRICDSHRAAAMRTGQDAFQ